MYYNVPIDSLRYSTHDFVVITMHETSPKYPENLGRHPNQYTGQFLLENHGRMSSILVKCGHQYLTEMATRSFDYSKWDNIELSDDESDLHPNIEKESWFRMKHRSRLGTAVKCDFLHEVI